MNSLQTAAADIVMFDGLVKLLFNYKLLLAFYLPILSIINCLLPLIILRSKEPIFFSVFFFFIIILIEIIVSCFFSLMGKRVSKMDREKRERAAEVNDSKRERERDRE